MPSLSPLRCGKGLGSCFLGFSLWFCPGFFFSFLGCSGFVGSFGSFRELGALYPFVLCCVLMGLLGFLSSLLSSSPPCILPVYYGLRSSALLIYSIDLSKKINK